MSTLSVCFLADLTGNVDEGMKVTASRISTEVSKQGVNVQVMNPFAFNTIAFWRRLIAFDPDIVHYVPGPSTKSYVLGRLCSTVTRSRLVMSAPLPQLGTVGKLLVSLYSPDKVFVQSEETDRLFSDLGTSTQFVPTGVDLTTYQPVSANEVSNLRMKYDLPQKKTVVLHIGHIKRGRNLYWLKAIQEIPTVQVVVVGSTSTTPDKEVWQSLEEAGCDVRREFYPEIYELYQACDIYVFPTISEENSIQCPASVVEALATGLPVVSTAFGALPSLFPKRERSPVLFVDSKREFEQRVNDIVHDEIEYDEPRLVVEEHGWDRIASQLIEEYERVLTQP